MYLREWIAFHLLQGISRFLIYDEGSKDGTQTIILDAGRFANVTLIDWSGKNAAFDVVQRSAYEDGALRLAGNVDFVAFIDADEFLFCEDGSLLSNEFAKVSEHISAVAVDLRLFGSSGLKSYQPGFVTARFTKCTKSDHLGNRWYKTIARPQRVICFDSVHSVTLSEGDYVLKDYQRFQKSLDHPGNADRIATGNLRLNHYMLKSQEEYRWKQERGQRRGMGARYDDAFFTCRDNDQWANALVDDRLKLMGPDIAVMISKIWMRGLFT